MIPTYNAPQHILTAAVQDATRAAMMHLCLQEGWLDSRNIPTPHDGGVIYQDNEMAFVSYVADEGSVEFARRGPTLRKIADRFGYEKSANCKAMILQCTESKMLQSRIEGGVELLELTPYGWETLARWEHQRALDIEIGEIEGDALPTQDEIEMAALLWGCAETEAENRLMSGNVARDDKWQEGTLFYI